MADALISKLRYLAAGLRQRWNQAARCPSCGTLSQQAIDRKYFHSLMDCAACGLRFRYPVESRDAMLAFYQDHYFEPGITTELPSPQDLQQLLLSGFRGSAKDFSYHIQILRSLGLQAGARILDFGANWGYATWQFRAAGYAAEGYEPSKPRAAYAQALGITIHTDWSAIEPGFDAVYSCHVLEHVPDPARAMRDQLALLKPGGLLIAHTPNGSEAYRRKHPAHLRKIWGKVHPTLLTDRFVAGIAGRQDYMVSSDDRPQSLQRWAEQAQLMDPCEGDGLFFVIRRAAA